MDGGLEADATRQPSEQNVQRGPIVTGSEGTEECEGVTRFQANKEEFSQACHRHVEKYQRCSRSLPGDHAAIWEFEIPFEPFRPETLTKLGKPHFFSGKFRVGEFTWKLLITAESVDHTTYLSIFLDNTHVIDAPPDWRCKCVFKFELLNGTTTMEHMDSHTFLPKKPTDRGYRDFQAITNVQQASYERQCSGGHVERFFKVKVYVKDQQTASNLCESSAQVRAQIKGVGLRNQGATCYLNSFLQTLFHLTAFRSATYRLPQNLKQANSPNNGAQVDTKNNIAFQLARLFYKIQTHTDPVKTTELTESFGWTRAEAFEQHDVQELARILLDNLETKMRGTQDEKTIRHMFMGKRRNYVNCLNRDYTSSRVEAFYDLQLQVKGCKNLKESIQACLNKEELTGDNKYHCVDVERGIDSKEDAEMGIEFLVFPPVLVMHLRRFEYDLSTFQYEKVNDSFEFPVSLDMKPYLCTVSGEPDAWGSDTRVPTTANVVDEEWEASLSGAQDQEYRLYSVLVHSGYMHGGHYHAYTAPKTGAKWYKFDDASVTQVQESSAVDDNYGGKHRIRFWLEHTHRDTSAYMLVYVRKDYWNEIVAEEAELPKGLEEEFKKEDEAEMQREKERADAHLYHSFLVLTMDDVKDHVNSLNGQIDLLPDPRYVDRKPVRVPKEETNLDKALSEILQEPNLKVWPTNHASQRNGFGNPTNDKETLKWRLGESKTRAVTHPLFKVPERPSSGTSQKLVFVKEYVKTPHGPGSFKFKGAKWLPSAHSILNQNTELCGEYFPDRVEELDALKIYIERDEKLVEATAADQLQDDCTILVLSWPLPPQTDDTAPAPSDDEVEKATSILGKYGFDRHNVYQQREMLERTLGEIPDENERQAAIRARAVLNHDKIRGVQNRASRNKPREQKDKQLPMGVDVPETEVSPVEYYGLQRERTTVRFVALSPDDKKTSTVVELGRCYRRWTHDDMVRALAPHVKWPPSQIRLWAICQSRADKPLVDDTLASVKTNSVPPEIGY
eukprot:gene21149-32579_t